MKFTKTAKLFISLALAVIMIASLMVPAMAYQTAFKNGADVTAFSQTAKDKMAAMKDGDNIFALGTFSGSAGDFANSGNCQFNFQRNDGKWGRAIRDTGWSINGMANIGDGIIDTATTGTAPAGCLIFSKKNDAAKKVNANAEEGKADSKYYTLSGWEFAANFKVKGFKIYFAQGAYADDFDILIGHLDGDSIVWEVAFSGNDMGEKFTKVQGTTNDLYSYEAEFCKTMEGRFIQIATKSYEGHSTKNRTDYYSYVCPEFEVYYGEVAGVNHNIVEAPASATCTEDGLAAHYECDKCGTMFSDAVGTAVITEDDVEKVEALGHNFVGGECTRCHIAGGVITNAAEFAAMDPAGLYTLANDITISESYASTFTGSFYGNGYTVTTTVPMFAELGTNANVHDFTVEGEIAGDAYTGAVAKQIKSGATNVEIYNVVNNADITGGSSVGGIVGYITAGATIVTITDCENNGVISGTSAQVGGIVGYAQGQELNIIGCTNNADIVLTASYGGGIVGRFGKDTATKDYICRITDCVNNGDFTAPGAQCGGMIGFVVGEVYINDCVNTGDITNTAGVAAGIMGKLAVKNKGPKKDGKTIGGFVITGCSNSGTVTGGTYAGGIVGFGADAAADAGTYIKSYKVNNCANYGKITSTAASADADSYAGGIAAYMYGGSTSNGIQNCINTGDVTVKDAGLAYTKNILAGGIIGYFSASKYYVVGNINAGKVTNEVESTTAAAFGATQLYWNNATGDGCNNTYIHDNFALKAGEGAVYGRNGSTGADTTTTTFTAEQLASGEVAYSVNKAAGSNVFFQIVDKSGADAEAVPTPFGTDVVYKVDEDFYSNYADGVAPNSIICARLALGTDISVYVDVRSESDSPAVTFIDADKEEYAAFLAEAKEDGTYVFLFPGLTPQMLNDTFTVVLDDGADKVTFNAKDYCMALLEEYSDDVELCDFVKALLHYGAAAQIWAGYNCEDLADLADSDIEDFEIAPAPDDSYKKKWVANPEYTGNVKVTSAGMYVDNANSLYFKVSDPSNVSYTVNDDVEKLPLEIRDDVISGMFARLPVWRLDKVYEIDVYDGDDLIGTLTYSGLSFIYSFYENYGAKGNFVRALYNCYLTSGIVYR